MWDLPRPGTEPVSPALAGKFFTTEPPGKPCVPIVIPIAKQVTSSLGSSLSSLPTLCNTRQFTKYIQYSLVSHLDFYDSLVI